jgi:single-strand DNA-binding protein
LVWEQPPLASGCPRQTGRNEEHSINFNQLTIVGFIGKNAETNQLSNRTPVTRFSVATTRSWKDDQGAWKTRTQWQNVVAFGEGFAQLAPRLSKGTHVFVQGELTTREYDRTIQVPTGEKALAHVIQQLVVKLKAETVRLLDRSSGAQPETSSEAPDQNEAPT